MAGNLFYRGVPTAEIKGMGFVELRYWNSWHEVIERDPKSPRPTLKDYARPLRDRWHHA
jgi:hypothetical protein